MVEEQKITHVNSKANSYEFGKASNRFKLYFEEAEDLKAKIDSLRSLGFCVDEDNVSEKGYN